MKIQYSEQFSKDIFVLYVYLYESFGERVADEKVDKIHDDIAKLADHPFMGKCLDGHDQNFRFLVCGKSVVIYDVNDYDNIIEVLRVVSAREDYMRWIPIKEGDDA